MLTKEERDIVVEAMRKYPAGISGASWGKSDRFFYYNIPKDLSEVEEFSDAILLEHG